ncbi:T9SS C-terminal target domain-containing protein [bacterium]|nr:MAG: T9SS C-terminal target domain-containing protein [bacterium]
MKKKIFLLVFSLLCAGILDAAILNVPADYATIQAGIDAANTHDTVLVDTGTYVENINYNGKNITVASLFLTTADTSYISQTVIDGNNTYTVVKFNNGEDSTAVLCGFTITNGSAYVGGGIYCEECSPSLINVIITSNTGGLYCINNSNPNLEDVTIIRNTGRGISCFDSSPILENVIIKGNAPGGGIYCNNANMSLSNVTITGNFANNSGGGILCTGNSSISFDPDNRCNIFLNYAGFGNDLYAFDCPPINVIVDTFTILEPDQNFAYPIDNFTFDILHSKVEQVDNNLYVSPDGSDDNSGLSPDDPLLTISWALIKIYADSLNPNIIHLANGIYSPSQTGERFSLNCRNYVSLQGEDVSSTILDGEETSRILCCYSDNYFFIDNMTIKNGFVRGGGGILCWDHSSPSITNVKIINNTSSSEIGGSGGGIYCGKYSSPDLKNVIISGNSADDFGGGILCYDNSNPNIVNVTISDNISFIGGGIFCQNASPCLINCILWNDTPNEITGTIAATYSDIQSSWAGTGNIDADPLFVDPQNADFHLTWANFPIPDSTMSPCIDAGDPNSPSDPDGTIADMGSFYFNQNVSVDEPGSNVDCIIWNYPNPTKNSTTIKYSLKQNSHVIISVYNIKGQLVSTLVNETKPKGEHTVIYNTQELQSGVHLYKIQTEEMSEIRKMIVIK